MYSREERARRVEAITGNAPKADDATCSVGRPRHSSRRSLISLSTLILVPATQDWTAITPTKIKVITIMAA